MAFIAAFYTGGVKSGRRWLRKRSPNRNLDPGGMTGVNASLPTADEDGDNEVGIGDFAVMSSNFGTGGPPGDVNGDGEVDIADYALLSRNYGMTGDD